MKELRTALHRPLSEVFRRTEDTKTLPNLARICQVVAATTWQRRDRSGALAVVMEHANSYLPGARPPRVELTWQEVGQALCGFREDIPEREDGGRRGYQDYFDFVLAESSYPDTKVGRNGLRKNVGLVLRRKLAKILEDLEKEVIETGIPIDNPQSAQRVEDKARENSGYVGYVKDETDALGREKVTQRKYVERPALERRFREAVDSGARLIAFIGQPGMGKTSLAKAVTSSSDQEAILIGCFGGKPSITALQEAYIHYALNPQRAISLDERALLATLLCGEGAPHFALLDGLDSADELHQLIPSRTKSIVVATCRAKGEAPPEHAIFIEVGAMTGVEARQLAQLLAPSLAEEDADYLAVSMYQHPLLIRYACGLAKHQTSVNELCDEIHRDAVGVASRLRLKSNETLVATLMRALTDIYNRDSISFALLSCIVWVAKSDNSREVRIRDSNSGKLQRRAVRIVSKVFLLAYAKQLNGNIGEARYLEAMKLLDDYGLVEESFSQWVPMHLLTLELIHELLSNEVQIFEDGRSSMNSRIRRMLYLEKQNWEEALKGAPESLLKCLHADKTKVQGASVIDAYLARDEESDEAGLDKLHNSFLEFYDQTLQFLSLRPAFDKIESCTKFVIAGIVGDSLERVEQIAWFAAWSATGESVPMDKELQVGDGFWIFKSNARTGNDDEIADKWPVFYC